MVVAKKAPGLTGVMSIGNINTTHLKLSWLGGDLPPFLRLFATKSYEFGTQSTSMRYTSIRSLCRTKTLGFSQIFIDSMSLFRCFLCLPSLLFCSKKRHFFLYAGSAGFRMIIN